MIGTDLTAWAVELSEALDMSVELEPRDLVLPGILVVPGPLKFDRLDGKTASFDTELWIVAGDSNALTALDELTTILLKLREYFGDSPTEAEPITVTLPSQSTTSLPALRCPIPQNITFPS